MANGTNGQANGSGRRWAVIAGVVFLVAVSAGLFQMFRPLRIRVTTTAPSRQDINSTISTNGKVEPVQNYEVHASFPSTVRNVFVREGQQVHKGQLLVQLDDADARAQLARAQAQLKQAESGSGDVQIQNASSQADLTKVTLERDEAQRALQALQRLKERGAASQAEVDTAQDRLNKANADISVLQHRTGQQAIRTRDASAQAAIENARVAIAAARQLISDSNIAAPFDGTVYLLPAKKGNYLNAGDLVLDLADLSRMQVRAFVDEPEIGHLKVGEAVKINWDALPGRIWQGQVLTVPSSVVARGNRNVGELVTSVVNEDRTLLPNTNVGVTIVTYSHDNALVLPREAVHEEDGKNYIYVIKDMHLQRRLVQLGVSNLTHVEILNGLNDGENVAVTSLSPSPLRDGVRVKIMEQS